jgi:aspartate/methionine/tyrosine aminotransferase
VISINSFSKYFSMTGWRLGWLVVPDALVAPIEKLAQNLYICPSTLAQHAAIACFEPESIAEYERRRDQFRARRDFLVPARISNPALKPFDLVIHDRHVYGQAPPGAEEGHG